VQAGLTGLDRNRAIVIPGVANRVGAQASRILPRAAMRRIIAAIKV
jgi:short-subunit dehydrogenase